MLSSPPGVWHSVPLHGQHLLNVSSQLFSKAMAEPSLTFPLLDKLLAKAADRVYHGGGQEQRAEWNPAPLLHLRLSSLPAIPYFHKNSVPRADAVGQVPPVPPSPPRRLQVIQFSGTVTKTGPRKLLTWRKHLSCTKCRSSLPLLADYDQHYLFCPPLSCPQAECKGEAFR